jgi:hypothetical protein
MIKRKLTRNPEKMTKSEVVEYFKENILPYVREKYESDRIIDTPARREAWNDMVDFLIKDGSVSKSAEDWGLPSQFERKERKNPTRIGTSYFKSISDAVRYYKPYNLDREDIMEKIRRGEIHIGKPPVRAEEFWTGSWGDVIENDYETYSSRNPKKSKKSRNPRNIQLKPAKRYSIDIPSRLSIILKRDPKSELGGEAIFIDGIFKGYIEKIDNEFVLTPASDYEGKDRTYYEGNKIGFVQGPSFYSYTKTALLERVQK